MSSSQSPLGTLIDAGGITPAINTGQAETLRCVTLGDRTGQVHVLHSASSLLDLDALRQFTGRELKPGESPDTNAADVFADTRHILLADNSLLEASQIVIEDFNHAQRYTLNQDGLRTLTSDHDLCTGSFSRSLEEINSLCNDSALDEDEINSAVSRFTTRRIKQRIEDTLDFPPMPEIANRIVQIGANENSTVKDLARVVEVDPSLSAQVVSWAASPYYAAPGKVKSIDDAILRVLGFDLVMNLALGLALGKTLRMPKEGRYGYRNYWVQAVHGATMMEALTKAMPPERRPQAGTGYLAGLLHNFGLLILSELMKPQLNSICEYTEANSHAGHPAVERHLLGVTREQMAACLMRFWNLPDEVCAALRYQHDVDYAGPHADVAKLLFVTTRLLGEEDLGTAPREPVPEHICRDLGISQTALVEISERILDSADDLQSIARTLAA